ncbi:MAG: FHA domain-containing protein [Gammaproteobacteria bacterium]
MEALIIKTAGRHGQQMILAKSVGDTLSIGRGFNNDVILDDLYIDETQLVFQYVDEHWELQLTNPTNPVMVNDKTVNTHTLQINSGDRLTLGRTQIEAITGNQSIEKTHKLFQSSWLGQFISRPGIALFLIFLASAFAALEAYQILVTKIEWNTLFSTALIFAAVLFFWAATWALTGRLLRHQPNFFAQLGFTALAILAMQFVSPLQEWIEYALNSTLVGEVLLWSIILGFLALLLYFNLLYATNIKHVSLTAFITSAAIVLFSYAIAQFNQDTFDSDPNIANLLSPPFTRLSEDKTVQEYLGTYQDQFTKIEID